MFYINSDINWLIFVGLFLGYAFNDALYAWYTVSVVDKRPVKAAFLSSAMYFMIVLGVLSYVKNILYVIPVIAGSWTGTYFAVSKITSKKKRRK